MKAAIQTLQGPAAIIVYHDLSIFLRKEMVLILEDNIDNT